MNAMLYARKQQTCSSTTKLFDLESIIASSRLLPLLLPSLPRRGIYATLLGIWLRWEELLQGYGGKVIEDHVAQERAGSYYGRSSYYVQLLRPGEQFRSWYVVAKVQDQGPTILTRSDNASVIALGRENPARGPILVHSVCLSSLVIGNLYTLIVRTRNDATVESVEEKRSYKAVMLEPAVD